jgi:hypothetical protein
MTDARKVGVDGPGLDVTRGPNDVQRESIIRGFDREFVKKNEV